MLTVNTIAPPPGAAPVADRVPSAPVAQAVATDLSPTKAVTAAETALAARNQPYSSSESFQRDVILDPATRDVILRVVDVRSRQVVRQVPDQALLRMHAYARALAQGKGTTDALNAANLEI